MLVVVAVGAMMMLASATSSNKHEIRKRSTACYDELGCFTTGPPFSDSPPRIFAPVPESPFFLMTKYYLYTKQNTQTDQSLEAIHLDRMEKEWSNLKNVSTQIIVHGYLDDPKLFATWMTKMKDELLIHGDHNVILVDWSMGNKPPYFQAAANTRVVGAQIAKLIEKISSMVGLKLSDFHIIGHSLGSHIGGYAGERLKGLHRITGLDPAGPEFQGTDPAVRLDPTDALLVDNIHTDGKSLFELGFGTQQAMGHMDFYPNEGLNQPGCFWNPLRNILEKGFIEGTSDVVACSHRRAIFLFVESINSACMFKSYPCKSYLDYKDGKCNTCSPEACPNMGFSADKNKPVPGDNTMYYLKTTGTPPFCVDNTVTISDDVGDVFNNITDTTSEDELGLTQLDAECRAIVERILTEKEFSNN